MSRSQKASVCSLTIVSWTSYFLFTLVIDYLRQSWWYVFCCSPGALLADKPAWWTLISALSKSWQQSLENCTFRGKVGSWGIRGCHKESHPRKAGEPRGQEHNWCCNSKRMGVQKPGQTMALCKGRKGKKYVIITVSTRMEVCIGRKNAWNVALGILETKQALFPWPVFKKGWWSTGAACGGGGNSGSPSVLGLDVMPACCWCTLSLYMISQLFFKGKTFLDTQYCCHLVLKQ